MACRKGLDVPTTRAFASKCDLVGGQAGEVGLEDFVVMAGNKQLKGPSHGRRTVGQSVVEQVIRLRKAMPRGLRLVPGGYVFHVGNRANMGLELFREEADFQAFEEVLDEGRGREGVRILGYCILPDSWQLLLWPRRDSDLSGFMRWVSVTHTRRWHSAHETSGHLYQGRFRSFPVQQNDSLFDVLRYIEQSPVRLGLASRCQDWPWTSAMRPKRDGKSNDDPLVSPGPVEKPDNWMRVLNRPMTPELLERVQRSVRRGAPYGADAWVNRTAERLGLAFTLRPRGRPRLSDE